MSRYAWLPECVEESDGRCHDAPTLKHFDLPLTGSIGLGSDDLVHVMTRLYSDS